jgi:hypothetical protein
MANKLNAGARRIVNAGEAIYGGEWRTKMAASIGISKQLLAFIAKGDRPVTDDVERKVAAALGREADRLRAVARKIDEIAGKMEKGR